MKNPVFHKNNAVYVIILLLSFILCVWLTIISTTTDINVAKQWAAKTGGTIVEIDLNMLPPDAGIYDLSTDFGRSIYLKGFTANNYAKSSSEVLIKGFIPSKAVKVVN